MEKSYTQAILLARVFVVKFLGHLIASVLTGRKACASAWQKSHWEVVLVPNRLYPAKRLLSAGCSVECPLSSCASFMYIKSTFGDWIFLGALSKLRKASCPSVRPSFRPSAGNKSAPSGRIFMKFDMYFSKICHENSTGWRTKNRPAASWTNVGAGLGLCTGNYANAKYLLVREGAENDLLVRQCTFVHAAAYCHTRDATQPCPFSELTPLSCIGNFQYELRALCYPFQNIWLIFEPRVRENSFSKKKQRIDVDVKNLQ